MYLRMNSVSKNSTKHKPRSTYVKDFTHKQAQAAPLVVVPIIRYKKKKKHLVIPPLDFVALRSIQLV